MDAFAPYEAWLSEYSFRLYEWFITNFASGGALIQITCILAAFLLARIFSRRAGKWANERIKDREHKGLIRIHTSYQELFLAVFLAGLLWLILPLLGSLGLPFALIQTMASLVTAWAVIRLTTSVIESPFWSRAIAFVFWTLAALNIVGWLNPLLHAMNRTGMTVGDVRITMLVVLKSIIAIGILFWAVGFLSRILDKSFGKARGLTPSQRVLFYKIANIALYVVGGLIALNIVGLDLTALTVFSGALGLGIGFGLQKVFSNLISGIILLLDKSVKPGDVIAVGDSYGWVNALSGRYVSVLTRDGKEHLIPNEDLITQQVENWSYSDQNVRIHIPVGVAYSSDIQLVRKLLLEAVSDHPRILKSPAPNCLIMSFGESSVNHEIRAWISDPQYGVSNVRSDVYYRIWELFKEHNIKIPFPQRDIHVIGGETDGTVLPPG